MKKIEIKLSIACVKCKASIMKAVAHVGGLVAIKVDPEKGLLTLIGDVDPCIAVKKLRKIKKEATIDSVGPYKKEEPPKPPTPEPEPEPCKPLPSCCNACRPIAIGFFTHEEPPLCTIL